LFGKYKMKFEASSNLLCKHKRRQSDRTLHTYIHTYIHTCCVSNGLLKLETMDYIHGKFYGCLFPLMVPLKDNLPRCNKKYWRHFYCSSDKIIFFSFRLNVILGNYLNMFSNFCQ
jgi:hypothetical protein